MPGRRRVPLEQQEKPTTSGNSGSETGSRGERTRALLIGAAVHAFSHKGFHGTTTRDIATAANMSPAAVYVHFESKEALLYAIAADGHQHILNIVRSAHASPGPASERLRTAVRSFAKDHAEDNARGRVVNHELNALSRQHLSEISEVRREIADLIRRLVKEGIDDGEFSTSNPAMAATMIMSASIDVARWYRPQDEWTPADVGAFYADAVLRLLGHHASSGSG
jgi:AcrR family transcriptional regulator